MDKRFTLRVNVALRDIDLQPSLHCAGNLTLFLSERYKKIQTYISVKGCIFLEELNNEIELSSVEVKSERKCLSHEIYVYYKSL